MCRPAQLVRRHGDNAPLELPPARLRCCIWLLAAQAREQSAARERLEQRPSARCAARQEDRRGELERRGSGLAVESTHVDLALARAAAPFDGWRARDRFA